MGAFSSATIAVAPMAGSELTAFSGASYESSSADEPVLRTVQPGTANDGARPRRVVSAPANHAAPLSEVVARNQRSSPSIRDCVAKQSVGCAPIGHLTR